MSSVPRFFVPLASIEGDKAVLPPDTAHHARNVLRLRVNETVLLHDGEGFVYEGRIADGPGKSVVVQITAKWEALTEPRTRITVLQALPKTTDKVEQVLQHGTEIGAAGFVFFQSERSVARMEARDKIEKRLERWAEIVKGAAEQSGRGVLPPVAWEPRLAGIAERLPAFELALILHEGATLPLRDALPETNTTSFGVIVGPEGGFTEGEVESLAASGAKAVTLGSRILRTETAALVAVSQILFARGE